MSVDSLIDEVRRRRTADEGLHLTAITVLAESHLETNRDDRLALAFAGWAAVRAEGATETFPTLSVPSLALVRSGVALTDPIFEMLPPADKANLVCIGFLGMVGERLGSEAPGSPSEAPAQAIRPSSRRRRKRPKASASASQPNGLDRGPSEG